MSRGPRYLPPGWSVEITTRTLRGLYLIPATRAFSRTFVGILARAQELAPLMEATLMPDPPTSHADGTCVDVGPRYRRFG